MDADAGRPHVSIAALVFLTVSMRHPGSALLVGDHSIGGHRKSR
jgi:hypothetical protein